MTAPSPFETGVLDLSDGRRLGYHCYGKVQGKPVHFLHGFPGSRYQAALLDRAAQSAGICLVAADRPGFGLSTPCPGRSILGFARDLAELADHLNHPRFAVLGVSCGGPYALAAAQCLPDRVTRLALLAGIAPMTRSELRHGQMALLRLMFGLSRLHPGLPLPLLAADRLMFMKAPGRALKMVAAALAEPDRRFLRDCPDLAEAFAQSLAEAYRPGLGGALTEVALIARDHGLDLARIKQPALILQSGLDRHVPPAMGRWLADRLPAARLIDCPDDGHLSVVASHGPQALEWLV